MAALTAAIIGASVLGAAATVDAANKNAKAAKQTAATNAATIDKTQTANTELFKPYVDRGNAAGDAINKFLGLNGTTAQDKAFDTYKDSTGYKFQLQSGTDAIASNKAASGLLKSGATLKALNKYGQDVASTYTQNYLANLGNQQTAGLSAASGNASSNSNAAGMSVNNSNNALANQTQSTTDKANALTNLLGNAVSAYSYGKGQSSYGTASSSAGTRTASPWYTAQA